MASNKIEATRDGYEDDSEWQKFLLDSYVGSGGYAGRLRRPHSGFWGQVVQSYSVFTLLNSPSGKDADTYLDRHDKEDDQKFNRRKNVANYSNYVRAITNLKISYIERKPNKRNNVPDVLAKWIEDTGYDKEMRRRMLVAAVLGWFPMLVDMPATNQSAQTAAQAGKLEPYCVLNLPVHLLDYDLDDNGKFIWAKLKSSYIEKAKWDAEAVEVERFTIWTAKDFTVYERRGGSGGEAVQVTPPTPHRFGEVPIVPWRADISVVDDVKADSVNADLVEKVRRLFNLESELDEHIRGQVFAILVWPGTAPAGNEGATVGTSNGLEISPEQKNVPFYLAPSPSVAATLETRVEKTIVEIYRIAGVEYERPSGVKSSAPSKENEFSKTNAQIASIAKAIADADRRTLILVGRAKGIPEEKLQAIEVVPHESYADEALGDELEQAIQALTISLLGKTARAQILQRLAQKLLPGMSAETWKSIQSEIEEAVEQEATDAETGDVPDGGTPSPPGGRGGQTPESELPADEGDVEPEAAE